MVFVHAQQESNEATQIQLKCDSISSTLDGRTHLQGNVSLVQGSLRLLADEIFMNRKPEGQVEITAQGSPVRFEQSEPQLVSAAALSMTFKPNENLIELKGEVELVQGENTIRGDSVEYDTRKGEILAGSAGEDSQIEIVLDVE